MCAPTAREGDGGPDMLTSRQIASTHSSPSSARFLQFQLPTLYDLPLQLWVADL